MDFWRSTPLSELRKILFLRQDLLTHTTGELCIRAVPALLEEFTDKCLGVFAALDRTFNADDREKFKTALEQVMAEAYASSHRSMVKVVYQASPFGPMTYTITGIHMTIGEAYEGCTEICGSQPDARPRAIAAEASDPAQYPVLDIGAGTGRNALAFARRGHPVDAVEITKAFADIIRTEAHREALNVRVFEGDLLATEADLRADYAMILVAGVVHEFRSVEQLRGLFELAARRLRPGGCLVVDVFLSDPDYMPDDVARQCAQQSQSTFFSEEEVAGVGAGLPLKLISDLSAPAYEQEHQPEGTWPCTEYYANWASGRDVFGWIDEVPIDLRWLVYEKTQ